MSVRLSPPGKRPRAYLIFRVKGGALIERRAFNRDVCVGGGGGRGSLSNVLLKGMLVHFDENVKSV